MISMIGVHMYLVNFIGIEDQDYGGFSQIAQEGKLTRAGVSVTVNSDGNIRAIISTDVQRLRAFWSGRWKSEWTIDVSNKTISGSISFMAHYFEGGNVQLHNTRDIDAQPINDISDPSSFVKSIIEAIDEGESSLLVTFTKLMLNMETETFKDMRRALPLTGQHFNWMVEPPPLKGVN